jgi:hypothetical protein
VAASSCVKTTRRRLSTRSAMAPASGESTNIGSRTRPIMVPSIAREPVIS